MKRKPKPSIPAGKVYVEWDVDAKLVKEIDHLAAREGRTRDALINAALAGYVARRKPDVADEQTTD
jgi:predicted transcriptional regulator